MKLVIALALFAVAFADVVGGIGIGVVSLPAAPVPEYSIPDISPLFVPQAVLDAVKTEYDYGEEPHYVELPVAVEIIPEAVLIAEPSLPFVPAEEEVYVPEAAEVAELPVEVAEEEVYVPGVVNFVDSPLTDVEVPAEAEAYVAEAVDVAELTDEVAEEVYVPGVVNFVDSPLTDVEVPAEAEAYIAEAVEVEELPVEVAEEEVYVPGVVNFVDSPLADAEPVMLAEAPLPAFESEDAASVPAVKIAVPSYPGKQFADPRLR